MCVAFDAESALKKIYAHVWEKKAASIWKAVMRNWNVRLKRRDLPYAKMRSRHGQSERIKRYINFNHSEEARKQRIEAMTHGVTVFTEPETVKAFLASGSGEPQPVSLKDLYQKEVASCTQ